MTILENDIKQLIIESLNLEDVSVEDISSEEGLFYEGLGLDSIDALELGMALQRKYNIKIDAEPEDIKQHFYSVKTIAEFVNRKV